MMVYNMPFESLMFRTLMRPFLVVCLVRWLKLLQDLLKLRCMLALFPFIVCCFFFFSSRRRHTRSLCDWSSDVCSSDLERSGCQALPLAWCLGWGKNGRRNPVQVGDETPWHESGSHSRVFARWLRGSLGRKIGRASCRERV